METQRILMRSLAVVFIASVIWTITVSAGEQVYTCCKAVHTAELTDPIIGVRMQKRSPPCVMAIIFETEQGEFCYDPRQPWVRKKVMQFITAQRNKRLSSTPPPASPTSEHTHVGGFTQSSTLMNHKHKSSSVSTDAPQEVRFTSPCCTAVSNAMLTDPITCYRKQKRNPPCAKAVIFQTERGEFCCDPSQRWAQKKVMQFKKAQRNERLNYLIKSASSISEHTRVRGSTQSTESS